MLFAIQFAVVLLCILSGAQVGGIGLGVFGGIGLAVMAFGFHLQPTSPPIDVMMMIMAVVSAAAAMQAAGGLDYLVRVATRVLHRIRATSRSLHRRSPMPSRWWPVPVTWPTRCCRSLPRSVVAMASGPSGRCRWR